MREFRLRESELDMKREEKLKNLEDALHARNESSEFLAAQRIEAIRQLKEEEREKIFEKIRYLLHLLGLIWIFFLFIFWYCYWILYYWNRYVRSQHYYNSFFFIIITLLPSLPHIFILTITNIIDKFWFASVLVLTWWLLNHYCHSLLSWKSFRNWIIDLHFITIIWFLFVHFLYRSKRIKVLRRLARRRNEAEPQLSGDVNKDIIDDYFDKGIKK